MHRVHSGSEQARRQPPRPSLVKPSLHAVQRPSLLQDAQLGRAHCRGERGVGGRWVGGGGVHRVEWVASPCLRPAAVQGRCDASFCPGTRHPPHTFSFRPRGRVAACSRAHQAALATILGGQVHCKDARVGHACVAAAPVVGAGGAERVAAGLLAAALRIRLVPCLQCVCGGWGVGVGGVGWGWGAASGTSVQVASQPLAG